MSARRPDRHFKLVLWWLWSRVPVAAEIWVGIEMEAAKRARMPWERYCAAKAEFPGAFERMLAKRAVRRAYLLTTGNLPPDGWAPLVNDGRRGNVPVLALKRRFSASLMRGGSLTGSGGVFPN